MAQETKTSCSAEGSSLRDIRSVLEKKIRNLEKRKGRLEIVEKDLELGKEISKNQRLALDKKDQVQETLEMVREFLTTADQLIANDDLVAEQKAKKAQKDQSAKILETVSQVLRLQSLLETGLQKQEIDDNEVLDSLKLSYDDLKKKNNFKQAARLWLNIIEAKPKDMTPGITFEAAHDKLVMIGEFLDKSNDPLLTVRNEGANGRGCTPSSTEGSEAVENQTSEADKSEDITVSPVEDSMLNQQIEAEHLAEAIQVTQPIAAVEIPVHPSAHYLIQNVGVVPVSPQHEEEDAIQFGSVEHVVQAVVHPITPIPQAVPPMRFESGEFDFLQDDLVVVHGNQGNVHMDPAVVAASSVPYDAHYHQMMHMHHQQLAQQRNAVEEQAPVEPAAEEETPNNEETPNVPKEKRSPNEHLRHHGHHDKNHYRNPNGNAAYRGEGRGWQNRNGNGPNWNNRGDRSENRNYNGNFQNPNGQHRQSFNGYSNRNNAIPRREQTAQRV